MASRLSILKQPIFFTLNTHLIDYPTPSNRSYWWGFGSLVGLCLIIQIVTGVFLAMHYTPHVDLAFLSVEHIMRDVKIGWLVRYMHAIFLVIHIPPFLVHITEVMQVLTNSFGVLKWSHYSQLWSYLLSDTSYLGILFMEGARAGAIPIVRNTIDSNLALGRLENATLNRFSSLHYLPSLYI